MFETTETEFQREAGLALMKQLRPVHPAIQAAAVGAVNAKPVDTTVSIAAMRRALFAAEVAKMGW